MTRIIGRLTGSWRLALLFVLAACLLAPVAQAKSLKAEITQVNGTTVQVRLSGKTRPSIGNTATIGFEVAGVGLIPLKGMWRVKRVSGSTAVLEPEGRVDQPRVGQIATIEATKRTTAKSRDPGKDSDRVSAPPARRKTDQAPEVLREDVRFIQRRLKSLGYDAGVADGIIGPKTRNAIRAYQRDRDMQVDGRASPILLLALQSSGETRETALADRRSSKEIAKEAYGYYFGKYGKSQDYAKAYQLNEILGKRDYAPGLYSLGTAHAFGFGVKKNLVQARQYFERAASKGHSRAMFNLAVIYRKGLGVKKDDAKATEYLHQAAATGLVEAYHALGIHYENGIGVRKNRDTAISWYRKAAAKDYKKSQDKLKALGVK